MKKIILKNSILFILQMILIIPYNYYYRLFVSNLDTKAYIFVIAYAIFCGIFLSLMNLENKIVTLGLSIFYLLFTLINFYNSFFAYGATAYFLVMITAYLLTSTIKTFKRQEKLS